MGPRNVNASIMVARQGRLLLTARVKKVMGGNGSVSMALKQLIVQNQSQPLAVMDSQSVVLTLLIPHIITVEKVKLKAQVGQRMHISGNVIVMEIR